MARDKASRLHGNKYAWALSVVLAAQGLFFYGASREEKVPVRQPLYKFPADVQGWQMVQDIPIEPEVLSLLKADDTLNRVYASPGRKAGANLFVAYFKTQRTGQTAHSPKNCLPGSGWEPEETGFISLPVAGEPQPIGINRYVVARGDAKSVVLYWYQNRRRVVASEYSAKFWLVADSIRYHRSDTALVRIVVPILQNDNQSATQTGVEFVQAIFPLLRQFLPS